MNRNNTGRNINDGFYELLFKNDGIYICVYPSEANGRRLDTREVIERLNRKRIRSFD